MGLIGTEFILQATFVLAKDGKDWKIVTHHESNFDPVLPATRRLTVGPDSGFFDGNNVNGVPNDAAPGFPTGSFASNGVAKTDMYFPPEVIFGRAVTIGEVSAMSWWTKKGTTHATSAPDWYMNIYTKEFVGEAVPANFYGSRFGSEPYFSDNINDPVNTWNEFSTGGPTNKLRFFESTNGAPGANFGSYTDPFWPDFIELVSLGTTVPRKDQEILFFSLQTATAWAAGFTGQLDGLRIELTDGSVALLNFEA